MTFGTAESFAVFKRGVVRLINELENYSPYTTLFVGDAAHGLSLDSSMDSEGRESGQMSLVAKALSYDPEWKKFSLRHSKALEQEDVSIALTTTVMDENIREQFESVSIPIVDAKQSGRKPSLKYDIAAWAFFVFCNLAMFFSIFGSMYVIRDQFGSAWVMVVVVKCFASLVMLNSAGVFLYMCRLILTAIASKFPSFLGVFSSHRWTQLHVAAALMLILGGCVHGFIWIFGILPAIFSFNNVTEVPPPVRFVYRSASSTATYVFASSVGLTGFLLLLVFAMLLITTIPKVMRAKFELFIYYHQLMWLVVTVLLGIHACQTTGRPFPLIIIFLFPAFALYLGEMCVRLWRISHVHRVAFHEILPNGLHHIEIELGDRKMHYQAADFVKLYIPQVSKLQWHPFSIASRPVEDRLRVLIKPLGDWTSELCKLLKKDYKAITIRIDGPFASPTKVVFFCFSLLPFFFFFFFFFF